MTNQVKPFNDEVDAIFAGRVAKKLSLAEFAGMFCVGLRNFLDFQDLPPCCFQVTTEQTDPFETKSLHIKHPVSDDFFVKKDDNLVVRIFVGDEPGKEGSVAIQIRFHISGKDEIKLVINRRLMAFTFNNLDLCSNDLIEVYTYLYNEILDLLKNLHYKGKLSGSEPMVIDFDSGKVLRKSDIK